jgi:PKD repeat protein
MNWFSITFVKQIKNFIPRALRISILTLITLLLISVQFGDGQGVNAEALPDLVISPVIQSHSEIINTTNHTYQINLGNKDISTHSILISGPVVNPKVLNDDSVDFWSEDTLANAALENYVYGAPTELERALAAFRFHTNYFMANGPNPEVGYWKSALVSFFNSYGGAECGATKTFGPQLPETMGMNGRMISWYNFNFYSTLADGKWRAFRLTGSDGYFLTRDNETIASIEDINEDHWLNRRTARTMIHPVTGALGNADDLKASRTEPWWYSGYDPNDPLGNNLRTHDMSYALKEGESFQRFWVPPEEYGEKWEYIYTGYQYPHVGRYRTESNLYAYHPNLDSNQFKEHIFTSENIETYADNNRFPRIHAASEGQVSSVIYKVESPYSILDGIIGGKFYRQDANDINRIYGSLDGSTWDLLWEQTTIGEEEHYELYDVLYHDDPTGRHANNAEERFSYFVKYEFVANGSKYDAGVNAIGLDTHVIVNNLTLPALHQGRNRITFSADKVNGPVEVTYFWNEHRLQMEEEIRRTTDPIQITLKVFNQGEATSTSTTVKFYRGTENLYEELLAEKPVPAIPPGGEATVQFEIPGQAEGRGPDAGVEVLTAVVDPNDTMPELDEDNNMARRLIRTFFKSELLTTEEFVTYYSAEGQIKAAIWNIGDDPATNFVVNIYEGSQGSGPQSLLTSETIPVIHRMEHFTVKADIDHPPAGIWVEIDPDDRVDEQFEKYGLVFSRGTQPPLVDAGPVRQVMLNQNVTLQPATVIDPDGKSINVYTWEIDTSGSPYGDENADDIIKTGRRINHTFTEEGEYFLRLTVEDADGEIAKDTTLIVVRGELDTTPPQPPTDLKVLHRTSNSITLVWTGPQESPGDEDHSGLWHKFLSYKIYRDGQLAGTSSAPETFTDTGLSPNTTYNYTIYAVDDAGNRSNQGVSAAFSTSSGSGGEPVASMNATPNQGKAPLEVNFDGSSSYDPDGSIVAYAWDFGDGTTGSGITASHIYTNGGTFTATLTVTDDDGNTDSDTIFITVDSSLRGDLNLDGVVDALDLKLGEKVFLGFETDTAIRLRADLNGDGKIDILDIQEITIIILGTK